MENNKLEKSIEDTCINLQKDIYIQNIFLDILNNSYFYERKNPDISSENLYSLREIASFFSILVSRIEEFEKIMKIYCVDSKHTINGNLYFSLSSLISERNII